MLYKRCETLAKIYITFKYGCKKIIIVKDSVTKPIQFNIAKIKTLLLLILL